MMRRKILLVLFLTISIFFIKDDVFAKVNYKNAELQCIYGNGTQVNFRYDKNSAAKNEQDKVGITLSEYPVGTTTISGEALTNLALFDCDGDCSYQMKTENYNSLKNLKCPDKIVAWRISIAEKTESGDWQNSTKGIFSFKHNYNFLNAFDPGYSTYITDYYGGKDGHIFADGGWWLPSASKLTRVLSINGSNIVGTGNANGKGYNNVSIPLVAERVFLTDDIGDDAYSQAFRVYRGDADNDGKEDEAQAVGGNKYIQLYIGNSEKFLHVGKNVTTITATQAGYFNNEYICVKESSASEDPTRGDGYKSFSNARHLVTTSSKTASCAAGYTKYIRTTKICKPQISDNMQESFCDKYPNVAFVLIDIIKIMQILVPAIVIIFTGIEIGRIVVAGNIEEELPKRKKSIIVRIIVMIAFIFLPLITQLIVSLAEGVSILDVSCLFNDGKNPSELGEENCEEAVK